MLNAVRPHRVFLATFAVPAVILPLAGYFWMRRNDSFIEMSIGSNPRRFSEIGAWISVAVAASVLYAPRPWFSCCLDGDSRSFGVRPCC